MKIIAIVVSSVIWLLGCSLLFVWLLSKTMVEGLLTVDALQWTIWPFVILSVAFPACLVLATGGLTLVKQLIDARTSIDALPAKLANLEHQLNQSSTIADSYADRVTSLLQAVEKAAAKTESIQRTVEGVVEFVQDASVEAADTNATSEKRPLAEALKGHYEFIKQMYRNAIHQIGPGVIESGRGFIRSENVEVLKGLGILSPEAASYMTLGLELEARTRRTNRANLTDIQIKQLDEFRKKLSWAEMANWT